jgi:hypothetical protein
MSLSRSAEPLADLSVSFEVVLASPAIEAEPLGPALAAGANDDRPSVAQPDVPEGCHEDFGKGSELPSAVRSSFMRRDQSNFFALAAGVDRGRECGDLALCGLQVSEPKLGIARKSNPDCFVRRPFGLWREDSHAARLTGEGVSAKRHIDLG